MGKLVAILLLFAAALSLLTGELHTYQAMRQAGKDYANGAYNAAERLYRNILENSATKESEILTARFNLAGALVMQNKHEEARRLYRNVAKAAGENKLRNLALYNEGTSLAREGIGTKKKILLEQALRRYTSVLLRDPGDVDARINYEIVLRMLQQKKAALSPQQTENQLADGRSAHGDELLLRNAQLQENSLMQAIPQRYEQKNATRRNIRDW